MPRMGRGFVSVVGALGAISPHGRERHGPGLRVPGEGSEPGLIDMWHMRSMTCRRTSIALLVFALPLAAGACARPVGAVRVDPQKVQRELTGNVLSTGDLSRATRNVLFLHGLSEQFADEPEAALDTMRKNILAGRTGRDVFPAAAELSFFHAETSGKRSYYLAAAVYAWMFLFPDGDGARLPDPLDPRLRMAADLYNRGITLGLASADETVMEMRAGTYELPWGELEVAFDKNRLRWAGRDLVNFVPIAELRVDGLRVRFRRPGIGAALAAGVAPRHRGPGGARHHRAADQGLRHGAAANRRRPQAAGGRADAGHS